MEYDDHGNRQGIDKKYIYISVYINKKKYIFDYYIYYYLLIYFVVNRKSGLQLKIVILVPKRRLRVESFFSLMRVPA